MMIEQTIDKLRALRLSGMVEAYRQQTENPDVSSLSFEERLGLMVDQHWTWRENKALARRLKTSRLPNRVLHGGHQLPLRPPTGRSQAALAVEL
jgi:hypothetical protein